MKYSKFFPIWIALLAVSLTYVACEDDDVDPGPDFSGQYDLADQKGRPAVNTVFVPSDRKDEFNTTTPEAMGPVFSSVFQNTLTTLNPGYSTNALGLDAATFSSVLATDVLTVSTSGTTTFFDGTNVLTGRTLADDVIDVELLLIFGGPDGTANPGLTSDNVSANDKSFLNTFPYLASPW